MDVTFFFFTSNGGLLRCFRLMCMTSENVKMILKIACVIKCAFRIEKVDYYFRLQQLNRSDVRGSVTQGSKLSFLSYSAWTSIFFFPRIKRNPPPRSPRWYFSWCLSLANLDLKYSSQKAHLNGRSWVCRIMCSCKWVRRVKDLRQIWIGKRREPRIQVIFLSMGCTGFFLDSTAWSSYKNIERLIINQVVKPSQDISSLHSSSSSYWETLGGVLGGTWRDRGDQHLSCGWTNERLDIQVALENVRKLGSHLRTCLARVLVLAWSLLQKGHSCSFIWKGASPACFFLWTVKLDLVE